MAQYNILLDSNIFIKEQYNFNEGSLNNLKKCCDVGLVQLYTNDIIIREVEKHINNDVLDVSRQVKNVVKKSGSVRSALGQEKYKEIEKLILTSPQVLLSAFKEFNKNSKNIEYSDGSIKQLFDDYFQPCEPFESNADKKSEFPDAAIILGIKNRIADRTITNLYIATDDKGWHKALKNVKGITVYDTLKELLDFISKEQAEHKAITECANASLDNIKQKLEEIITATDYSEVIEDYYYGNLECEDFLDYDIDDLKLKLGAVEYIDHDDNYANISFVGKIKLVVRFRYINHSYESYDREDDVYYNTQNGEGRAILVIPVDLPAIVILPEDEQNNYLLDDIDYNDFDENNCEVVDVELKDDFEDDWDEEF